MSRSDSEIGGRGEDEIDPGSQLAGTNGTHRSAVEARSATKPERWRRSEETGELARSFDSGVASVPQPGAEVERILREYACECYAVGRGQSMYYLVDDLPRLAREAAREIMALEPPRSGSNGRTLLSRSAPLATRARPLLTGRKAGRKVAAAKGTAKSLVAALPFIAILAVIGLTISLSLMEFVRG
jgi:hypothetical protein